MGSLWSVPTSAARPMSTSLTQNQASWVASLMSVAVTRSTPPPTQAEWMAQITGFLHRSSSVNWSWYQATYKTEGRHQKHFI